MSNIKMKLRNGERDIKEERDKKASKSERERDVDWQKCKRMKC